MIIQVDGARVSVERAQVRESEQHEAETTDGGAEADKIPALALSEAANANGDATAHAAREAPQSAVPESRPPHQPNQPHHPLDRAHQPQPAGQTDTPHPDRPAVARRAARANEKLEDGR